MSTIQSQTRKDLLSAVELLSGTNIAIASGAWTLDGACDPSRLCQSLQQSILEEDLEAVNTLKESLAEGICVAAERGDLAVRKAEQKKLVAQSKAIFEAASDRLVVHSADLAI